MLDAVVNPKNQVQSLAKGFRVLGAFTAAEPELTLSAIATSAELDPGTAFRLVNTLLTLGYLDRVDDTKRYRLTFKVLDLGFNAIARTDLRETARPLLRSLVGEVNEAASVAVLDGPDVVYVERVQAGLVRLGVDIRIGSRIPAYYTAIGHSLLAYLSKEERRRVLNLRERVKLMPRTVTSLAEIEARLERVRERGYAVSDEDAAPGLRVLAAPVPDADGHPLAAISVAAPAFNISSREFVAVARAPVMKAAAKLGRAMTIGGSAAGLAGAGRGPS